MIIQLTQGYVAHVDAEDYDVLMHFHWCAVCHNGILYAQGSVYGRSMFMHRFIMEDPPGVEIDHRDRNSLNNRRHNLRPALHHQNISNAGIRINNTSGFKGVYFHKQIGRWMARVMYLGRHHSCLSHASAEEAARYYNLKAVELHGEFAVLNDVIPRFPSRIRVSNNPRSLKFCTPTGAYQ